MVNRDIDFYAKLLWITILKIFIFIFTKRVIVSPYPHDTARRISRVTDKFVAIAVPTSLTYKLQEANLITAFVQ